MARRKSNINNARSKDKLRMRVKRSHESEEQIATKNSRVCARLAPIKEGKILLIIVSKP